ncbi:MAG: protein phosphatase 2C domain-containing protein [Oscillospiraceae bacterium]|nr:protein phosphatase 2C domain-containing protein [Oscillospiraceae bacterium]
MIVFGSTHAGLVRPYNQDRFECAALSDTLAFAVLCDGIGGENGGGVAAELSAGFAATMLRRDLNSGLGEFSLRAIMQSAFSGANALVLETAKQDEALTGMGTTMIIAVHCGRTLYLSNVGDSRAYLVSGQKEELLSHDHTLVQMLVDSGKLSEEEALTHPQRHYLTRAVGVAPVLDVEFSVHDVSPGETALLCSDGLYHYLQPGGIHTVLAKALEENSAQALITHALSGGGGDNVTAVVMHVKE